MEIEFDRLASCYFMKLEKVLEYWGRDPETFITLSEGEELFYKQLVLNCGVTEQTVLNIFTYSLVCETNKISTRPQPVEVKANINFHGFDHDMSIKEVKCSGCGDGIKCKHVAAVLIYLNRHDISVLPDIVGKDLTKVRAKVMKNFYNDSDEESSDEEELEPYTIVDGIKYDNSEGVPPRERFHLRFMDACDRNQAEREAKGETVSESSAKDDDNDQWEDIEEGDSDPTTCQPKLSASENELD